MNPSHPWVTRVANTKCARNAIDRLVLDYLVVSGFRGAAEALVSEAGLPHTELPKDVMLDTMDLRLKIYEDVRKGDIDSALSLIIDYDLLLLDTDIELHFILLKQKMIELMRSGKSLEALCFAQTEIVPRVIVYPTLMRELEDLMLVLVFPSHALSHSVLQQGERDTAAINVNTRLMSSLGAEGVEPRLPLIMKFISHTQNYAPGGLEKIPRVEDFEMCDITDENGDPLVFPQEDTNNNNSNNNNNTNLNELKL